MADLFLTLLLTVFAIAPLAYPGYLQAHSGFIPVYNLADLASSPLNLDWSPNVATTFDPLRGDGLLPYYLALPFVWLTGSPLSGVKAIFALSFLLGATGVYLWLRRPLGPVGAALAAMIYTYLPYHLAVVYVRGAWGEALFLGVLPWGLLAASPRRNQGSELKSLEPAQARTAIAFYGLIALTWIGMTLSQAGLAIWGFVLLVIWLVAIDPQKTSQVGHKARPYAHMAAALIGLIVALALTLWNTGFSLPASPLNFFDHFLYPAQLFSANWGFGASRPGWEDGLALGFGFAAVGLGMLTLFILPGRSRAAASAPQRDPHPNPWSLFILVLASTLLLLPLLAFLWRLSGLSYTLTYPWQLLGIIGLVLSVLGGMSVRLDNRLASLPLYAGLIIITLLASYPYLEPRFTRHPLNQPLAAWDDYCLMLLDYNLSVEIPPSAAGLREATPGRLPLSDYGLPEPGDSLHVTFTWQVIHPFDRDLKLFLHLLDASGQIITQVDPLAGAGAGPEETDYLTSRWAPGELIAHDVAITIPPDAPLGPYRLAFGLYDGDTLERLPVVGRADGQVEIEIRESELASLADPTMRDHP